MDSEAPDEPERDSRFPEGDPKTDGLFAEVGFGPTPLDRARDRATELIATALQNALQSSRRLREQRSTLWHILWRPLDSNRRLAPYPTDPFGLRRWPALIDDVRRHVRRALPRGRQNRDAWPSENHVIWQEAFGMVLGRDDLGEQAALLHDMPSNEFAKMVKRAWVVGPRLEIARWEAVPLAEFFREDLFAFPVKAQDGGKPSHVMAVWNWSITRLKSERERAARDSLRSKLGPKVWRTLTAVPIAKLPSLLRLALADEIGTRRLSVAEKQAEAEAESKGLTGGPGEQLRWSLSAEERSALRQVVDEVRRYGRPAEFIEGYLIRDGKRAKLRAIPGHLIRQDPQVRAALMDVYQMFADLASNPLGELVDLILTRVSLRVVWATQDWDGAKSEADRKAARQRLREMLRRQLSTK